MEKLFQWAIINSATEKEDTTQPSRPERTLKDLDPDIIDAILGKDDATVMREILDKLEETNAEVDQEQEREQKKVLFEDLEMLVGHIDNAKNLKPLGMWPRLLKLMDSDDTVLCTGATWVVGTSVQNNPPVKVTFIEEGGLSRINKLLVSDLSIDVRLKALYCLSGLLQNAPPIIELFAKQGGYDKLLNILQDEKDVRLRPKTLFLFHQLAIQCPKEHLPEFLSRPFLPAILQIIKQNQDDEDLVEKGLHAILHGLVTEDGSLTTDVDAEALLALRKLAPELQKRYGENILSNEEWALLVPRE